METKKINLKEFKKESLQIQKLLDAKGGSCGGVSNSTNCITRFCEGDFDTRPCDTIC